MSAIVFGSISTVIDTSELQRASFNSAFAEHDLDWTWDVEEYRHLLVSNGGADRIADYAAEHGDEVDAAAVHATKSAQFQRTLTEQGGTLRPGVAETVAAARAAGWQVALVTTTSPDNITALFAAASPELSRDELALVVDSSFVEAGKPAPDAYLTALDLLGERAEDCIAIEDNLGGVDAARAAGITCVAFPNENTAGHDFGDTRRVERLDFDDLRSVGAGQ